MRHHPVGVHDTRHRRGDLGKSDPAGPQNHHPPAGHPPPPPPPPPPTPRAHWGGARTRPPRGATHARPPRRGTLGNSDPAVQKATAPHFFLLIKRRASRATLFFYTPRIRFPEI